MNWMRSSVIVIASLSSVALRANAVADVRVERVNGYEVNLINIGSGNKAYVMAYVPVGSKHDDPVLHAGRAHLFEHVIFRGSERFPNGEVDFQRISKRVGGAFNAATGGEQTYYHFTTSTDGVPEVIDYLTGLISKPLWNQEGFLRERKIVQNEAGEYQDENGTVLWNAPYIELLPVGHPLRMYDVGEREQLEAMEIGDLQDLFFSNYTPEKVGIFVAGNFKTVANPSGELDPDFVLAELGKKLEAPVDPRPAPMRPELFSAGNKKIFPSTRQEGEPKLRYAEFSSKKNDPLLLIHFERKATDVGSKDFQLESDLDEILVDYLNLDVEGSFADVLKKKRWTVGFGIYRSTLNNLKFNRATFRLTEEGIKNRNEIIRLFFAFLNTVKNQGIDPAIFQNLVKKNYKSYEQSSKNPDRAAHLLAEALQESGYVELNGGVAHVLDRDAYFDFETRYKKATRDLATQRVDDMFPMDSVLVGYVGPDVVGDRKAQTFDRQVRIVEDEGLWKQWLEARNGGADAPQFLPVVPELQLRFSEAPLDRPSQDVAALVPTDLPGTRIALFEKHTEAEGAVQVGIDVTPLSLRRAAALSLYLSAFREHFKSEIDILSLDELWRGVSYGANRISLTTQGNSHASLDAAAWALRELRTFVPRPSDLQTAIESLRYQKNSAEDEFSAFIAYTKATQLLHKSLFSPDEILAEAQKLLNEPTRVAKIVHRVLRQVDINLSFYGDYSPESASYFAEQMRSYYRQPLDEADRIRRNTAESRVSPLKYWTTLHDKHPVGSIGIARFYPGTPQIIGREALAAQVLSQAIDAHVTLLNRTERDLGYVNNAGIHSRRSGGNFVFYGMTEKADRWAEISDGWEVVLQRLEDRKLTDNDFADEIQGLIRSFQLEGSTPDKRVARLASRLEHGDLNYGQTAVEILKTLTPDEIYAVGDKYLLGENYLTVQATHTPPRPCEDFATSTPRTRARLAKLSQKVSKK